MGCGVHSKGNTIASHQPRYPSLLPALLKNYIGPQIETAPDPDPSEAPESIRNVSEAPLPQPFTHVGTLTSASIGKTVPTLGDSKGRQA
jgi:hypothetical protein